MRLRDHTDYALRTLLYLGLKSAAAPPGERAGADAREIAAAYGISLHHERKVAQHLAAAGFVETSRGRGGGLRLARAPEEIRIGRVVAAMEADVPVVECFRREGNACALTPACALKRALAEARRAFIGALDAYTLADLVEAPNAGAAAALLGLGAPD